jgi:flagellar biosynthetic protein FlhB
MTKEEVKQETRQADIAPEMRGAIRKKQFQMSRKRMLAEIPTADVVIVNPTHFAVALRYDPLLPAPEVIAKGVDHIALAIRAVAEEHGIPLVENKPLARTLYREVEVGRMIPEALFVAVAEVLAFVFRTAKGRARARRRAAAKAALAR